MPTSPSCTRCDHPAVAAIYPGKSGCVLLCHCCFGKHWEHLDAKHVKGELYLVVPLTLAGFHTVFGDLYHEVEDVFTQYRLRAFHESFGTRSTGP